MTTNESRGPKDARLQIRRRVPVSAAVLVESGPLYPERASPLTIRPAVSGVNLIAWAKSNLESIEAALLRDGAILFRGFDIATVAQFEQFVEATSSRSMEYRERSSPRQKVGSLAYTSTDFPADQSIFLHNENSYANVWPMRIYFFCVTPARQGGETPIADSRKILRRIAPEVCERFRRKGVMYTRNFGDGLGLPWQTVFQTESKLEVEQYCRNAGYELEWKDHNRLRLRRVGQAIAKHPRTGDLVWFNHAAFFHVSTLEPSVREALLRDFKEDELPNNTFYGDGSRIEPYVLDEVRAAYRQETITFLWEQSDILMLDNMLFAHGRAPFTGPRKVLVAMADPITSRQI